MAEKLSIDPSVYSRYEKGEVLISGDKLIKASELFNVDINEFFNGIGSNSQFNNTNSVISNVLINYNEATTSKEIMTNILDLLSKNTEQQKQIINLCTKLANKLN